MALKDIYRTITSKAAQRTVLYSILIAVASSALYGIAAIGYLAFYHEYVPHRVRSTPVHLQYGPAFAQFAAAGGSTLAAAAAKTSQGLLQRLTHGYHAPYGLADLRQLDLKSDQEYDISIVLSLPHSPANLAVGNFMVELVMSSAASAPKASAADITSAVRLPPANPREFLESQGKRVLFAAARPAILAYTDPLVAQAKRMALLPVHFFAPEAASRERLIVPMAESLEFAGGTSGLPAVLYLELRTPGVGGDSAYELQTYGVEVVFSARLRGLRWLMYHHRIFAFLLLTTVSWIVEVAFMAGVLLVLGAVYGRGESIESTESDISGSNGNGKGKGKSKSWETSTVNSSRAPSMSVPHSSNAPATIKKEEKEDVRLQSIPAGSPAADSPVAAETSGSAVVIKNEDKKENKKTKQEERVESQARISSLLARTAGSPTEKKQSEAKPAKKGKAPRAADDVDDYDSYTEEDYSDDEVVYEDDIEPEPRLSDRRKKTSQIPQSPKKSRDSSDGKDSAVATGRASSALADTPLRQRQSQPQTPKKEPSNVSVNSPASPGKENSMRKKTAVSQDQTQVKPP